MGTDGGTSIVDLANAGGVGVLIARCISGGGEQDFP